MHVDLQPIFHPRFTIPPNDSDHPLAEKFHTFIKDPTFPCLGAKSAQAKSDIRIVVARDIGSGCDDQRILAALIAFIAHYRAGPHLFKSFAVIFENETTMGERDFEEHLWARVQSLSDRDIAIGHKWDARVEQDPADQHFSLSFAGEAFFVVGLHPGASRLARRFEAPVLVFNLHSQFKRLRDEGRYEKMREMILERDRTSAGSINPMLARHGEVSEARQYSGRAVSDDWACPFQVSANGIPPSCPVRQ